MSTHPTALELIDAVIGFIETRAAPQLADRDVFLARVAVNALGVVRREVQFGGAAERAAAGRLQMLLDREGSDVGLNAALCEALRDGALDERSPGVLAHLKASLIDQVRIDQPNYSGLKAALDGEAAPSP